MMRPRQMTLVLVALYLVIGSIAFAQKKPVPACRQTTFAAFKTLPKLEYDCPEGLIESDDKILKLPARFAAIRDVVKGLESFNSAAWWQADVDELNACEIHGSAGELTEEEREKWKSGDYGIDLLGDHQIRLALLPDPCYQTGYNGANTFLLYRKGGRVYVTQVLNGYYSRIDNSIGVGFAVLNGQQLVEVSSANNMPPSLLNYYFLIDSKTGKAMPKKLFNVGDKLTNEVYSAMLMNEPADVGLSKSAEALKIFSGNRLAQTFSSYEENKRGKIDDNGRKLRRIIYRWNGQFYAPAR
jgi:hypothetical protein